jgi:hypothetical protein
MNRLETFMVLFDAGVITQALAGSVLVWGVWEDIYGSWEVEGKKSFSLSS